MGLFRELVLLPFAPLRGVLWTVGQVLDVARYEQAEGIRRDLLDIERSLQDNEITEEEFDRLEDELLDRLDRLDRGEVSA
jgi:hypothetical protein